MGNLWKDLRYGLRALMRAPGFTAVAALTLALGISTNTTAFSVIDAVLFRPYPYKQPEQLAVVRLFSSKYGFDGAPLSYPDFAAYKAKLRSFQGLSAIGYRSMNVGQGDAAVRVRGVLINSDLFQLVGSRIVRGRSFLAEEDRPGGERVAVLSEAFWKNRLGGDPKIVGRAIQVDGEPRTVVGIVASDSQFPAANDASVFIPIALDASREAWEKFLYFALGRLKPGVSLAAANAEIKQASQQVADEHPAERKGWTARAITLRESRTGQDRPMLMIGLGCAAFVLLIACVNVANLLLQRGATKQRELAVRTALGASRSQVLRQLMTESVLLALLGAAAGLLFAHWLLRLTVRLIPPQDLPPYLNNFALNGRTLLYLLGVTVFTVLAFGLFPSIKSSTANLKETLSEGGQGSEGSVRRQSLRNLLVIVEVGLSMVLLVVCGLLIGSLFKMVNADPGIDRYQTLIVDLPLPESRYTADFQRAAFYRKVLDRARVIPGIQFASLADNLPFGAWGGTRVELEGAAASAQAEIPPVGLQTVTESYFETLGQTLVAGRAIEKRDTEATAQPVVVLNARTAKKLFPDRDPLGQRLKLVAVGDAGTWVTVVGVTENIRRRGLADDTSLEAYVPAGRLGWPGMALLAHVPGDPLAVLPAVRKAVQAEDSTLAVVDARTLDRVISDSFTVQRVASIICGVFGLFALLMAAVGMYGSLSYTVQQRQREIGIRMALGAQNRDVVSLVVGQILKLVGIGLLIGVVGAFAATKLMASLLFGVGASDLLTVLAIAVLLTLIGLLASWIPARRASAVPPVITLRAS
jgi:putative ABC transport system permease protein